MFPQRKRRIFLFTIFKDNFTKCRYFLACNTWLRYNFISHNFLYFQQLVFIHILIIFGKSVMMRLYYIFLDRLEYYFHDNSPGLNGILIDNIDTMNIACQYDIKLIRIILITGMRWESLPFQHGRYFMGPK